LHVGREGKESYLLPPRKRGKTLPLEGYSIFSNRIKRITTSTKKRELLGKGFFSTCSMKMGDSEEEVPIRTAGLYLYLVVPSTAKGKSVPMPGERRGELI